MTERQRGTAASGVRRPERSEAVAVTDRVEAQLDDGVLVLRLSRPERRNVLDTAMTEQLAQHIESAGADVGAITLLAEGDHFCVGGDVGAFGESDDPREFVGTLASDFHRVVRAMRDAVPIVVGMRGWAAGAGMSIVLAADLVVAGESASMRPAYPGIGVTPDGGMTWALPRLVGGRRALAILLENRAVSAAEGRVLGIVDYVVADDAVDSEALAVARRVADGPRAALSGIKRLVREGAQREFDEHLDAEAASIAACAGSAEGQEGIHAFLERREPDFRTAR